MVRNDLMSLTLNPNDKRSKLVRLTTRGQEWANQILGDVHQFETKTMSSLGAEKTRQLNSLNEELLKRMKEEVQR